MRRPILPPPPGLAGVPKRQGEFKQFLKYDLEAGNWLIYALGVGYGQLSASRDCLRQVVGS